MVITKSREEINKYIAERLYGVNFEGYKPHEWVNGHFKKCRRCGKVKPRGRLPQGFNNLCRISEAEDYFKNWEKTLTKFLEDNRYTGVEIIQTNIGYRAIIYSTLKHRGFTDVYAEVEKSMLREAIIYAVAESLEQL